MEVAKRVGLFEFRKAICSELGPDSATKRLILLVLSIYMDKDGSSCFPSIKTISRDARLSERAISANLSLLSDEGWIIKIDRWVSGRGWRHLQYKASVPQKILARIQHLKDNGDDPGSTRQGRGDDPDAGRVDPDDNNVLTQGHTISSYNSRKNSMAGRDDPGSTPRQSEVGADDFLKLKKEIKKRAAAAGY
jgi:hypothetical protein